MACKSRIANVHWQFGIWFFVHSASSLNSTEINNIGNFEYYKFLQTFARCAAILHEARKTRNSNFTATTVEGQIIETPLTVNLIDVSRGIICGMQGSLVGWWR